MGKRRRNQSPKERKLIIAAFPFVVGKLPSYLNNLDQLHSDTWSDGLSGYFQNFASQDGQVNVEIGSYYDDTGLNCQVLSHFNY